MMPLFPRNEQNRYGSVVPRDDYSNRIIAASPEKPIQTVREVKLLNEIWAASSSPEFFNGELLGTLPDRRRFVYDFFVMF
jgi:hypothetical protein